MSTPAGGTEVRHPLFARLWHLLARTGQVPEQIEHRRTLVAGLRGRVLELGAGDGLNFPHYPATVEEVVAVEPEPYLRERAADAATTAPVPVRVVGGVADRLPASDGEFDAAVVALVLCSVPDQAIALAELRRVLRPGGELRFYEHVRATGRPLRVIQAIASPAWPRLMGGCQLDRDTAGAIVDAGFQMQRLRRFPFAATLPTIPVAPRVLGTARRP